ncbi:MAG: TrmH family RNA methyltransferase [Acidimicrobiales bacterium]
MAPSPPLTANNRRIKRIRRLLAQRRQRVSEGVIVVEGPVLVAEAIAAGRVEEVYLEPGGSPDIEAAARRARTVVHHCAPGVLAKVLDPVNPQPVAAVVPRPSATLDDLPTRGRLIIVVDGRDPGNLGTLLRSAEASGAVGVVLAGHCTDPSGPKTIRAAAGAALRLPVVEADDPDAVWAHPAITGRVVVALVAGGTDAVPYDQVDLREAALMVGNEASGLPAGLVEQADTVATIPLAGPTESLNLAVAASVACFEALRQERHCPDGTAAVRRSE